MDRSGEAYQLDLDREDIVEVLRMRFGQVPEAIVAKLADIDQYDVLQRLVLIAANAVDWRVFIDELEAGEQSFKILGERFDPASQNREEG